MSGPHELASPTVTTPRVDGLSDSEQATLTMLAAKLRQHEPMNALRTALYHGERSFRQVTPTIPSQYRQTSKIIGWPSKAVDLLARRMTLTGFDVLGADAESLGVSQIWDENELAIESHSSTTSALLHGPAFVVTTRGDERAGEPKALIHTVDALSGTGEWNARTRRMSSFLHLNELDDESQVLRFTLYLPGTIVSAARETIRHKWIVARRSADGVPVERLPFRPLSNRPFGSSRITRPVMGLTGSAMRVAARMEGNADVYQVPQLILLGGENSMFRNADGSVKREWQIALGRFLGIPDEDRAANPRAQVQVVQAASPQPHLDQLRQYAQLFSGETSIPVTSLGVSDMSNPSSADSYIASREDLISEAETATDVLGVGWARALARAISIYNGVPVDREWKVTPKWRAPQHLSRAAQADAGAKQIATVPWLGETEIGLELLGLNESQISRALSQKRRADGDRLLEQILSASTVEPDADDETDDEADDEADDDADAARADAAQD